jgi:hypothetical protein
MRVEVSATVAAPVDVVVSLYRDFANWPNIFPTIRAVGLVSEQNGVTTLNVDHIEGKVVNTLAMPSPTVIKLREWKRHYDATFVNCFERMLGGTRFTVVGNIAPKGLARLLTPVLGCYAKHLIRRYQIEPIKRAAERTARQERMAYLWLHAVCVTEALTGAQSGRHDAGARLPSYCRCS